MGNPEFVAATHGSGTIVVCVKPNSSKNGVLGYSSEKKAWMIAVKAAAEKDAANKELLRFLKKLTGKQFLIKNGLRSKEKVLVSTSSFPSSQRTPLNQ